MSNVELSALIIAPPGRWRDSLRVLLQAGGQITRVDLVEGDGAGPPPMAGEPPTFVFVDAGLADGDGWWVLEQLRFDWPCTHCIVLAHTIAQERQAHLAGADAVLQVGFSGEALYATIRTLMERSYRCR